MNDNTQLVTISVDNLATVNGGGLLKLAEKGYKWWTKTKKLPSPKELFDEGVHLVEQVGKVGGIAGAGAYAGKKLYDWWHGSGGEQPKQPAPQE